MNTKYGIQIAGAGALALTLACTGCGNAAPSASTPAATTSATTSVAATRAEPPTAKTEEQKVPEPSATQVAQEGNVADGGSFTVDIPAYWQGRVQWSASDGMLKIYPTGMPNYSLIEIEQESEPSMEAGDAGSARVGSVQLGSNSYAEAWITRWAYFATLPESQIASVLGSSDAQTISSLDTLVDLQTGGAMSYSELASNASTAGQVDVARADEFLTTEVIPTIRAK